LRDVSDESADAQDWLEGLVEDPAVVGNLLRSMMRLLKEPVYSTIPDLFSHSQTVYKFDGESLWNSIKARMNPKDIGRTYRRIAREEGFASRQRYSSHFYPEDILCFFVRGLLYNDLAKRRRFPYHPHPARAILVSSDALWSTAMQPEYAQIPVTFVRNFHEELARYENSVAGLQLFDLDMPPIFAVILRESKNVRDLPRIALEIRNSTAAHEYRSWIEGSYLSESGLKVIAAQRELDELKRKLRLELGLDSQSVGISLWKISFNIRVPSWLHKMRFAIAEPHTMFIRELARASLDVINKEQQLIRIWRQP
jgi:hypothetical protein